MKKYRIFLVIAGRATTGENNYIWVRNLYDPLINLGHDVYLVNLDEYLKSNGFQNYIDARERFSNDLPRIFLTMHKEKPFDIFLSYLQIEQIIPQALLEIKKYVYTINYSTNFHQFDLFKEVATTVDLNIYISKIAKQGFDTIGVKSYWMPLAANPQFYKPSHIKNDDSVFIGSVYGPRPYLFWRLLQYGMNLQLYGSGWVDQEVNNKGQFNRRGCKQLINSWVIKSTGYELKKYHSVEDRLRSQYGSMNQTILSLLRKYYPDRLHGSLDDQNYMQTLANAGLVINIQESRYNHDYYNHQALFASNLRDFEATLCGSFLCTQYSSEIEELFEVGKEIICYHNEHDLVEKIQYYNHNKTERNNIAKAGYSRSIQSHTWEKRFEDFFNFLKL